MLAGNVASIGVGAIVSTVASLIVRQDLHDVSLFQENNLLLLQFPENFDFESTRAINKPVVPPSSTPLEEVGETSEKYTARASKGSIAGDSFDAQEESDELDPVALNKAFIFATWSSVFLVSFSRSVSESFTYCNTIQFVVLILLVPLPLFFSQHVYTVGGFTGWVVVGIIWTFLSSFTVVIYPLYESRKALRSIATGLFKVSDLFSITFKERVFLTWRECIGFVYEGQWEACRPQWREC